MQVTANPAGTFCWVELGTTDPAGARQFYEGLFGWTSEDYPTGPGEVYTVTRRNTREVGGLYGLRPEQRAQGVPSYWLSYVRVDDADRVTAHIKELGGTVVAGPFDAGTNGRMTVAADTEGAMFAIWQPMSHPGLGMAGEDGTVCWTELATRNPAGARAFYGPLFGWEFQDATMPGMPYVLLRLNEMNVAGLFEMPKEMPSGVPAHWMTYFEVADCDERAEWARAHGGTIVVQPTDIPDTGRFAVLQDPQGAVFSIMTSARR